MESLKELYRVGRGPSSSHTIGPEKICEIIKGKNVSADHYKVILYGSLASTGVGHGTDNVIKKTLHPASVEIIFDRDTKDIPHPNTLEIFAYKGETLLERERAMSVGGGEIRFEQEPFIKPEEVYPHNSFLQIKKYIKENQISLFEYVKAFDKSDILNYLCHIWQIMKNSIASGLQDEGILPGGLNVRKRAKILFSNITENESETTRENRIICSYAFAVSEQNACGEKIVTAPTCGSSGVMPAVLFYCQKKYGYSDEQVAKALAVGGLIGNLIKTNASISGAECGCQAEVGSACAMAAAALGALNSFSVDQIECAAEIAIEHHLGLTCDPICGLVQIPCIERNAVAAMRAINAANIAKFLSDSRKIALDDVIETMRQTGLDLSKKYKETSGGGLANITF